MPLSNEYLQFKLGCILSLDLLTQSETGVSQPEQTLGGFFGPLPIMAGRAVPKNFLGGVRLAFADKLGVALVHCCGR